MDSLIVANKTFINVNFLFSCHISICSTMLHCASVYSSSSSIVCVCVHTRMQVSGNRNKTSGKQRRGLYSCTENQMDSMQDTGIYTGLGTWLVIVAMCNFFWNLAKGNWRVVRSVVSVIRKMIKHFFFECKFSKQIWSFIQVTSGLFLTL